MLIIIIMSLILVYTISFSRKAEIQAFYRSSNTDEYTKLRYDLIKTVVYAEVEIDANGSLLPSGDYNPEPLIRYSHDKGVKVVLMFQFKDAKSADMILVDNNVMDLINENLLNEVRAYNFDGIDIDLENINETNSINGESNKQLMTNFISKISDTFRKNNSNYRISMDIGLYFPETDKIFDVAVLQNKVDYIMIMGYDMYGEWSSTAGPNSPINLDSGIAINDSIKHYKLLVDKKKLLLGVPWFGHEFATNSDNRLSPINGNVNYIFYKDYIKLVNGYNVKWDSVWQTPWYTYQDSMGQWYQGHYDDVESLSIKYDLVNSECLSGIGIWTVNYGIDNPELWSLMAKKFD